MGTLLCDVLDRKGKGLGMRVVFFGATKFSERLLRCLLQHDVPVNAIFTIPEEFTISLSSEKVKNYNYSDLSIIAEQHRIPCYQVDSVPGKKISDYTSIIRSLNPDVVLVLGWYYMVPVVIRSIPRYGAWGIHASLLPNYAGNAPLVWAMICGESETGVTLFKLDKGVDDGDIIAQIKFPILFEDTIKEVYDRATDCSEEMLIHVLNNFDPNQVQHQDKNRIKVYPPRSPKDGKIDLSKTARELYDFIRAQTRPYPGAFSTVNDRQITFWKVRYHPLSSHVARYNLREIFETSGCLYVKLIEGVIEIISADYDQHDTGSLTVRSKLIGQYLGS